jgi:hypothetical protein
MEHCIYVRSLATTKGKETRKLLVLVVIPRFHQSVGIDNKLLSFIKPRYYCSRVSSYIYLNVYAKPERNFVALLPLFC